MREKSRREAAMFIIGSVVIPLVCVFITYLLTKNSAENAIVKSLSSAFDYIDSGMSYEQALQSVYEKSKNDDKIIADLNEQIKELKRQNSQSIETTDKDNANTLKIDLTDTKVLYDGMCYKIYLPSEGNTFSMGSKTYNDGFVMYDDHSLFGEGDGYTLFDLGGEYSKISFSVGRTNEYEKQDVVLKVYLNGEYTEEYSLSAQSTPIELEIDLKYANELKLEITGGSRVKYGFANVVLYY